MISIENNCTPWYKRLFNDSFLNKEKQYLEDMKCNTYFTIQQIYFIFHFAEQEIDWTMVEKVKI